MSLSRSRVRIVLAGFLGAFLDSTLCPAQALPPDGAWSTPASGYIYDQLNRAIRPVGGFIGSASLGPAVVAGVDWASVAPNRTSALLRLSQSLVWIPNLARPSQVQTLNLISAVKTALWSADSTTAVILGGNSTLTWLSHFDSSPSAVGSWSLPSPGPWTLLAVDSAANRVLLASSGAGRPVLWAASLTTGPAALPVSVQPAAAAFVPGAASAYIADASANQIVCVSGLDASPSSAVVVTSTLYITDPSAIVLSVEGRLFLANHGSTVIYELDSVTGALLSNLQAEEAPQSLIPFSAGEYLLEPAPSHMKNTSFPPILLLDTSEPAKVLFIPRGR